MKPVVFNIKALRWHYPSIAGVTKQILMKVTDTIGITFIDLTETFILNRLSDSLTIDL